MKIAYAGDWHSNTGWAIKAINHASFEKADIIVHLGDYGYDFHPGFIEQIESTLAVVGIELWFVDGNHEDFSWLYKQPIGEDGRRKISDHVYHLPRGFRWEWNGVKFLAMGGAYSVDRRWRKLNASWWREETITPEQVEKAIADGPADVLVSHDCPSGVTIPGIGDGPQMWPYDAIMKSKEHQEELWRIVDAVQPREIWHGHYHRRYDALVNFGYGQVEVHGLDMDATSLASNIVFVELPDR